MSLSWAKGSCLLCSHPSHPLVPCTLPSGLTPSCARREQMPLGVSALPPRKCGHVARLSIWWASSTPSYPDCSINPPASSRVALPPIVPARKPKPKAQRTSDQNINWTPKSAAPPQTHHSRASPTLGPLDSLQVTLTLRRTNALLIPTKCEGETRREREMAPCPEGRRGGRGEEEETLTQKDSFFIFCLGPAAASHDET